MPEEVNYNDKTGLIRIRVWGDDPIEDWIASRNEVIRLHEKYAAWRLLVDVREQGTTPSVSDIFEFGENWPSEIRLAILMGEETSEDVIFLETVAINRAKQVRVFYDEEDAVSWLNS